MASSTASMSEVRLNVMKCKPFLAPYTSPDDRRLNIMYKKAFRKGDDVDFYEDLLKPMANDLKQSKAPYPLTIVYLPLKRCGFAYKYFEMQLGNEQYYPTGAEPLPENRLFAQYHSPQTNAMRDQILNELASPESKVRIIFPTVAMGMGVNIPSIQHVIHVGPPRTIREYFQETGRARRARRARRDGHFSTAILYYNNRDIANNREGMSKDIKAFCQLENACLRKFLLKCLDRSEVDFRTVGHLCCSYCASSCECVDCLKEMQ
ncbi:recQ-like DNA helicase Blm [Montipora capricornis]|uniref:recQ-like DNA helicase Blm n=1 Tax=Montipora capricornis TaxID=246305 RepID=UPI0035F1B758